jgi:FkbM family methyltransferase
MVPPTDPLFALLSPARLTAVVDIGANPIDGDPPYKPLLARGACRVIGFDSRRHLPRSMHARAILNSTCRTWSRRRRSETSRLSCPGMTSLLRPDPHMLSHFDRFPEFGRVLQEITVPTRRLDDIVEIDELDFLKLDVQGSELAIFRHGRTRVAALAERLLSWAVTMPAGGRFGTRPARSHDRSGNLKVVRRSPAPALPRASS